MLIRVTLALALIALTPAEEARACSCADGFSLLASPRDGATGVPTDAVVWVFASDGSPTVSVDGVTWSATQTIALADGTLTMFESNEGSELAPNARHELAMCGQGIGCQQSTFGTGFGPAEGEPVVPRVTSIDVEDDGFLGASSCGESVIATIKARAAPNHVMLLDTGAKADTDPFAQGSATLVTTTSLTGDGSFSLGNPPCSRASWDFEKNDEARFRVGSFDAAGRFSGWSKRHTAENGCSGAAGGSVLGAFLVLLLRRRP